MTGLVLLWCLAQAPTPQTAGPIAVVVSSKRPGADAFAGNAAARVHAALLREGVPAGNALDDVATGLKVKAAGFSDARNCQGGASCLTKLADCVLILTVREFGADRYCLTTCLMMG